MKRFSTHLLPVLAAIALLTACKKKEAAGPAHGMVVQVVAVEAKRQAVSESLSLVGTIAANEIVEIKAENEGIVQEILFNEGQRVEKGQLLLRLDESKWAATLAEAEANFKLSQANFDRSQQLLKEKLISQQEFDQAAAVFEVNRASLELKKRNLRDARVVAPFSGISGARSVSPGQVITRNSTLTWLVDLDQVKVELYVPEKSLSQLKVGQSIEFDVAAYPGQKFKGQVYFIAPQVDLNYRTALVKAMIPNDDLRLKPGMFANLELTLKTRGDAIVIPEVAVFNNGDSTFVYLVTQNQTAQMQPVKVEQRLRGWAEIGSGLLGGESVVVEGHQKLVPGVKVRLAGPEAAAPYLAPKTNPGTAAEKLSG